MGPCIAFGSKVALEKGTRLKRDKDGQYKIM